ncbi:MAG: hypothetical protein WA809_09075, partial [Candidatus Dormiibacterota bacterium]
MSSPTAVRRRAAAGGADVAVRHAHAIRVPAVAVQASDLPAPRGYRWQVMLVVAATTGVATALGLVYIHLPLKWPALLVVFAVVALLETRGGV